MPFLVFSSEKTVFYTHYSIFIEFVCNFAQIWFDKAKKNPPQGAVLCFCSLVNCFCYTLPIMTPHNFILNICTLYTHFPAVYSFNFNQNVVAFSPALVSSWFWVFIGSFDLMHFILSVRPVYCKLLLHFPLKSFLGKR